MTPEEKQLLLKDLCARLPYGVICKTTSVYYDNDDNELGQVQGTLVSIDKCRASFVDYRDNSVFGAYFEHNGQVGFKPYLRPMSSMTDEEIDRMWEIYESGPAAESSVAVAEYLYERHLDCHYLIEKGLALEAPEKMYKTE